MIFNVLFIKIFGLSGFLNPDLRQYRTKLSFRISLSGFLFTSTLMCS